jgi:hypothetical protein
MAMVLIIVPPWVATPPTSQTVKRSSTLELVKPIRSRSQRSTVISMKVALGESKLRLIRIGNPLT